MIEIRIVPSSREDLARVVELLKKFGDTLAEKPAAVELGVAPGQADTWMQASIERAAQHYAAQVVSAEVPAAATTAAAAVLDANLAHPRPPLRPEPPAPAPAEPPAPPAVPEVTLEQVRAQLAALAAAGKKAEVRDLLTQVGAERLTEVSPKLYAFLLEKAKALR